MILVLWLWQTKVLCFRSAYWSIYGWNDMVCGIYFKIIWSWGKVGGSVDKIRLALHWHLLKLGDSWGTWGFIRLFFLLLCMFENFHNKKWRKGGRVNIYCSYSLEKSNEVAFFRYVIHICFFFLWAAGSDRKT